MNLWRLVYNRGASPDTFTLRDYSHWARDEHGIIQCKVPSEPYFYNERSHQWQREVYHKILYSKTLQTIVSALTHLLHVTPDWLLLTITHTKKQGKRKQYSKHLHKKQLTGKATSRSRLLGQHHNPKWMPLEYEEAWAMAKLVGETRVELMVSAAQKKISCPPGLNELRKPRLNDLPFDFE